MNDPVIDPRTPIGPFEPPDPIRASDVARWIELLVSLTPADQASPFVHPDSGSTRIDATIGLCAWHGRHHLAQIEALAERKSWGVATR